MLFEHLNYGINNLELDKQQEIEMNKKISKLMSNSRKACKLDCCYHCKQPTTKFCNSHFVPRFCLENIGINGEVTGPNSILKLPNTGIPISKEHIGINSSGTFQIICRDCDSKIFQKYEDPNYYSSDDQPNQVVLAQIAMKDYLKFISKRMMERALYEAQREYCMEHSIKNPYFKKRQEAGIRISNIDLLSYENDYKKACKIAISNDIGFYVIFYKILDYVTPIAVQTPVALAIDLEGNVVNDIFNMDLNYNVSDLHICVFPLKTKTAVIMFIKEGDKKYRKFYKQFRKLSDADQLAVINYLVFLYSEDYFLARDIDKIVDLNKFNEVAVKTPIIWNSTPVTSTSALSDEFALTDYNTIPNLLSEYYKLR